MNKLTDRHCFKSHLSHASAKLHSDKPAIATGVSQSELFAKRSDQFDMEALSKRAFPDDLSNVFLIRPQ